ncbi:HAD-superfamily hydrolase, subfamily IIB [Sphaerochaeta pleomorpha str. Grapes]|uniref:HAD-superfamily hydrolase, subfamily IIB n=1 Tax=Sphaerochaeta pleomorpha (strain ATCC BAA-1885 / DSM 22778 / Grapes) TaxID=158190 RepID=G8QRR9_SPHPG|nr:Cof-type HAD-IIB family hydrolase [Sphaerochaeta pleomorpha]AEV28852.1 HAD-superfamily hydrolase, subfamily IIB [Sphaerochaeta pleomorpha str. Grapes]
MFDCKLICTDIDGTLLNSEHRISEENKKAIQLAVSKNILVSLVSGRIAGSLAVLQRELGITGPLGCYSGSLVLDGEEILASHPITNDQARRILASLASSGLQAIIFGKDQWFIDTRGKWHDKEANVSQYPGKVCNFASLLDTWDKEGKTPYKILCMSEDTTLVQEAELRLHPLFSCELNIFRSSPHYLEISAKGIDKGHAVHAICKKYGFSPSQVMAVGDFYNDLGMFREAGYSVAMGNAPSDIKSQADTVTLSNNEHGLAVAIQAIL